MRESNPKINPKPKVKPKSLGFRNLDKGPRKATVALEDVGLQGSWFRAVGSRLEALGLKP